MVSAPPVSEHQNVHSFLNRLSFIVHTSWSFCTLFDILYAFWRFWKLFFRSFFHTLLGILHIFWTFFINFCHCVHKFVSFFTLFSHCARCFSCLTTNGCEILRYRYMITTQASMISKTSARRVSDTLNCRLVKICSTEVRRLNITRQTQKKPH